MNREVSVTKRVKTPQGLRCCPVVLSANGRIRPDWVLVNGREERHPEGAYYLERRQSENSSGRAIHVQAHPQHANGILQIPT